MTNEQTLCKAQTVETLRIALEAFERAVGQRFVDMTKHYDCALADHALLNSAAVASNALAIDKAEKNLEARLNSMNEFRAAMGDQIARFVTRDLHDQLERDTRSRMDQLSTRLNLRDGEKIGTAETKQASAATLMLIVTTAGAFSGVIGSLVLALLRGHL